MRYELVKSNYRTKGGSEEKKYSPALCILDRVCEFPFRGGLLAGREGGKSGREPLNRHDSKSEGRNSEEQRDGVAKRRKQYSLKD